MTSKPRSQAEPVIAEIIDGTYLGLKFCVACGINNQDELHHHHLIARSQGGSDDDTNIVTFCVECHGKLHGLWRNNHRELIRN
jgi:5-methylcytosine-specific restriction endonuclease McrA